MILTAAALITAGCGGSTSSDNASGSATSSQPSTVSPSDMSNEQAPPARLVIDVTIKDGKVTPTNEQLQSGVNEPQSRIVGCIGLPRVGVPCASMTKPWR